MEEKSTSVFRLKHLQQMPVMVWCILVGTWIVRTSYFMAWPFLVIILYQDYHASPTEIGTLLGLSALVSVISGFYSGHLSDLFGRKWMIIAGCLVSSSAYFGISQASQLWHFYLLFIGCGLMRPMIEAPSKALISDCVDDLSQRELAMNIRYFAINLGGAIGPLIGVTLTVHSPKTLFAITAATYLCYAITLFIMFSRNPVAIPPKPENHSHLSVAAVFRVIVKDGRFIILLCANTLLMFVYAHYEATIPQIVTRAGGENIKTIIAGMVLINTITITLLQFPLLSLLQRFSLTTRVQIGIAFIGLSQLIFLILPAFSHYGWFIGGFLLSLGEAIAFPTLNVQIDRIAPAHLRGVYFGAASVQALGFTLAPVLGGLILEQLNTTWLFSICLICCLITFGFYFMLRDKKNQIHLQEQQVSVK